MATPRRIEMDAKRTRIKGIAARAGHWSAANKKKAIGIWIAFVVFALIGGGAVGQRDLTDAESGVGQSKSAEMTLDKKGPKDPATESVLLRSETQAVTTPAFSAAIHNVRQELESSDDVTRVYAAKRSGNGHAALVNADLRGDPEKADETADSTFAAVERAR